MTRKKSIGLYLSALTVILAVVGVIAGAVVANLVKWGFPAINGMAVAAVCYLLGQWIAAGKEVK